MSKALPDEKDAFTLLGKVLKPHGIRGELKVLSFAESPYNFTSYSRLYLTPDDTPPEISTPPYTNKRSRVIAQGVILQLAECVSREQAESLTGAAIWLSVADLPAPGKGEFYLHSLRGKTVRLVEAREGETLGRVCALLSTSGQDIMVIRQGEEEFLVPAVRDFFVSMDNENVVLRLPPGLLEINRKVGA